MRWLFAVLLGVVALSVASPAAADPPSTGPLFPSTFEVVNPCTDAHFWLTYTVTVSIHRHDSRTLDRFDRTLTGSDGTVGHGTQTAVNNGQVLVSRTTDILSNPSGDRMRFQSVLVIDLSTRTINVERLEFTCLGP